MLPPGPIVKVAAGQWQPIPDTQLRVLDAGPTAPARVEWVTPEGQLCSGWWMVPEGGVLSVYGFCIAWGRDEHGALEVSAGQYVFA